MGRPKFDQIKHSFSYANDEELKENIQELERFQKELDRNDDVNSQKIKEVQAHYNLLKELINQSNRRYKDIKSTYSKLRNRKTFSYAALILFAMFAVIYIIFVHVWLAPLLGVSLGVLFVVIYLKIIRPINRTLSGGLRAKFGTQTRLKEKLAAEQNETILNLERVKYSIVHDRELNNKSGVLIREVTSELQERTKKRKDRETRIAKLKDALASIQGYIASAIASTGMDLDLLTEEIRSSFDVVASPEEVLEYLLQMQWEGELFQKGGTILLRKDLSKLQNLGEISVPIDPLRSDIAPANQSKPINQTELQVLREFEYLGGQIRFKVGMVNQSPGVLTDLHIKFTLPTNLKWVRHEPLLPSEGTGISIAKLGVGKKKSVSIYLEPVSCLNGAINATVSYFDSSDRHHAMTMVPKPVAITCPIFFTREEANFARVQRILPGLTHSDRKLLPILLSSRPHQIFNAAVSTAAEHDIKQVRRGKSETSGAMEAWFYGVTKVTKQRMVVKLTISGDQRVLELEVSGDSIEAITGLLAELESQIREKLIKDQLMSKDDPYYDFRTMRGLQYCPFCMAKLPTHEEVKVCPACKSDL